MNEKTEVLEHLKDDTPLLEISDKIDEYMEAYQNSRVWLDVHYMCIMMEHS